jgi:predicted GNAT family N-acyltransferase
MQQILKIDDRPLRVTKLMVGETVKSFDCGDADLNDFILHESPLYRKTRLAVTYVLEENTDINHEHIVAFFSLSNDRISMSDFDNKTRYNRFSRKFNNRKRLKSYPAAKIGRLGVDIAYKGRNLGSNILMFIKRFFTADNKTGCRFLTVDAYAAAIPFYLRNGFVPLNEEDADEPTRLLYFDLSDLDED